MNIQEDRKTVRVVEDEERGEEEELIIVCQTEGERERRGRVANSVCDVGIDQWHRQRGGT